MDFERKPDQVDCATSPVHGVERRCRCYIWQDPDWRKGSDERVKRRGDGPALEQSPVRCVNWRGILAPLPLSPSRIWPIGLVPACVQRTYGLVQLDRERKRNKTSETDPCSPLIFRAPQSDMLIVQFPKSDIPVSKLDVVRHLPAIPPLRSD